MSTGLGGAALGRTTGETVGAAVGGVAVGGVAVGAGVVDEGVSATGGLAAGEGLVGGEGEDAGVAAPECGADRVASTTPASPPAPAARPATTKTTLRHAITDPEASAGRPASGRGNAGTSPGRRTRRARRTGRARRRTYRRGVKTVVAVLACLALGGCGGPVVTDWAPGDAPSASAAPSAASVAPSEVASAGVAFVGTTAPVTAAEVAHSWHPGCPVGPDQLRLLRLSYWGFDDRPHVGTMVVHGAVAADVVAVFATLYRERFPIRQMQPAEVYGGSDPDSMAADNTSAFNCRYAVGPGTPHWSAHAYGQAVDVNTVENPYLDRTAVLPPAGAAYLDRSAYRPGMAVLGGLLVRAFAARGWQWGGRWASSPDYQHFSRTGG